jgi:hypothetical protein
MAGFVEEDDGLVMFALLHGRLEAMKTEASKDTA